MSMRAIGQLAGEFLRVFLSGVAGFFAILILAAGTILAWLIGCASALFLLIAVAEAIWWLYARSHHAAINALGYFGYAAGTFALIPVLFWSKERLAGWPERRRQRAALRQMGQVTLAENANFEEIKAAQLRRSPPR
jgi:hypothetical protein